MQKHTPIEIAKNKHFQILRKNNMITDSKNGELSLTALKLQDIVLGLYQDSGATSMKVELAYLRRRLKLTKNNNYVDRIKVALAELKLPIELRDFTEQSSGKEIKWQIASFLGKVRVYKDTQHVVDIEIDTSFVEYMVEKAGYTELIIEHSVECRTKYAYKLYEMYLRYYGLPNRVDKEIGIIRKNLPYMNEKFGTTHSHPSKMMEGINRGIKEVKTRFNVDIFCFYDKIEKQFVFSWAKDLKKIESKCIIPFTRIEEMIEWIILHSKEPIKDSTKYAAKLKQLILANEYEGLEESYRGMLQYRYGMTKDEISRLKTDSGRYTEFSKEASLL